MGEDDAFSLRALYRLAVPRDALEARVEALRHEQSVEVPPATVRDPFVQKHILPRVERITEDPAGGFRVELAYARATSADDPAQLLNVLFGNCSMLEDVMLLDVELPESLRQVLGGPRYGIEGLRRATGVFDRPLTCTAIKPMGLGPEVLADLCRRFARAGLDVIKDDHGLADHAFCRFDERVERCRDAVEAVARETGRRALYAPNLVGSPASLKRQLERLRELGIRAALVSPMLVGLPAFHELARAPERPILLAHPALSGAPRIAPRALLGRLFRAFGADAVIFPHAGGRFPAYDEATCRALADALREPAAPLRPALPVPAGGMSVERAEELVGFYGRDAMLLVGGSLYEAGAALEERSAAFVAAVERAAARAQP